MVKDIFKRIRTNQGGIACKEIKLMDKEKIVARCQL